MGVREQKERLPRLLTQARNDEREGHCEEGSILSRRGNLQYPRRIGKRKKEIASASSRPRNDKTVERRKERLPRTLRVLAMTVQGSTRIGSWRLPRATTVALAMTKKGKSVGSQ